MIILLHKKQLKLDDTQLKLTNDSLETKLVKIYINGEWLSKCHRTYLREFVSLDRSTDPYFIFCLVESLNIRAF